MSQEAFYWKNANGLKIYANEWRADGDLRGVIGLVHGLGEHMGRYQHDAAAFNQSGYSLIGFDLPGHGHSEGKRGHSSYEGVFHEIDHLLETARQRSPGKPVFLYGHSMGGAIILEYLLKCKADVQGAVITAPGLAPGYPIPGWKLTLAKVMDRLMPSFTLTNGLDQNNLSHDPAVARAYQADPLVHDRISAQLGLDLLTHGDWIIAHAREIPAPLLLMQGSLDHLVSIQSTEAFVKAAPAEKITYKVWDGFYHELHNELENKQVFQVIIDWLDKHATPGTPKG